MRKSLLVWILVAVGLSSKITAEVRAATTLELWTEWAEGPYWETINMLAERYQQLTKGVVIKVVPADIRNKLPVAIAGGSPPDITFANGGTVPTKISLPDLLTPLTPLMIRDQVMDDYLPASLLSFATWEDTVYAAPYSVDPNFAVCYNMELFENAGLDSLKPPDSIETLLAYSNKLFRRDGSGKVVQTSMVPWRMYGEHTALLNWSFAFGGQQYADGKRYNLTIPAVRRALDFMIEYGNRYGGPLQLDALGNRYRIFDLTHIAMQPLTSPDAMRSVEEFPDISVGFTYLPAATGGVTPVWLGGQWLAIPAGSRNVEEAWKFIRWVTLDLDAIKMTAAARFAGAKAAYGGSVYTRALIEPQIRAEGPNASRMAMILAFYATLVPKAQPILEATVWYWSDISAAVRALVVDRKGDPATTMEELNRILNLRVDQLLRSRPPSKG